MNKNFRKKRNFTNPAILSNLQTYVKNLPFLKLQPKNKKKLKQSCNKQSTNKRKDFLKLR